jgi:cell division protein YceG involved in septum cleavage
LSERLESGRVREHRLTIVEGWTVARLRQVLADDPRLVRKPADLDEAELMAADWAVRAARPKDVSCPRRISLRGRRRPD